MYGKVLPGTYYPFRCAMKENGISPGCEYLFIFISFIITMLLTICLFTTVTSLTSSLHMTARTDVLGYPTVMFIIVRCVRVHLTITLPYLSTTNYKTKFNGNSKNCLVFRDVCQLCIYFENVFFCSLCFYVSTL